MILKEIKNSMLSFSAYEFSHERRACNFEAHRLARTATTLDVGRHVWLSDPPAGFMYSCEHYHMK